MSETIRTLDDLIARLEALRDEVGGEMPVYIEDAGTEWLIPITKVRVGPDEYTDEPRIVAMIGGRYHEMDS